MGGWEVLGRGWVATQVPRHSRAGPLPSPRRATRRERRARPASPGAQESRSPPNLRPGSGASPGSVSATSRRTPGGLHQARRRSFRQRTAPAGAASGARGRRTGRRSAGPAGPPPVSGASGEPGRRGRDPVPDQAGGAGLFAPRTAPPAAQIQAPARLARNPGACGGALSPRNAVARGLRRRGLSGAAVRGPGPTHSSPSRSRRR